MELNEIVETKFLPPESTYDDNKEADFGIDSDGDLFIPWVRHLIGDSRGDNIKFYIKDQGCNASLMDSAKTFFKSIEEANKYVWKFFRSEIGKDYTPKALN